MKKKIKYLLFIVLCNLFITKVYAASASIKASASSSKVQVGDTVTIKVNVSSGTNLGSWGFNVGYNSKVFSLVSSTLENNLTSLGVVSNASTKNKEYTLKFKAKESGSGTFSINNAEIWSLDEEQLSPSISNATVTVVSNSSSSNTSTAPVVAKKYTVTFNSNGGSNVSSQTVSEGGKVSKPSNPTKSGYNFSGWTLNGVAYNFNSAVKSNITLTATWTAKQNYTVTFNSNGGSNVSSQAVVEGNKATQPANPTREGYTFSSWTLNGAAYNFNSAVNSNITLTATWTQKTYVVKVTLIDTYSPDRILTVYENGTPISVSAIKYSDGYTLCSGSNTTVNKNDIEGENTLIVVLSGGTQVTASVS